jgi:hypothetical protein
LSTDSNPWQINCTIKGGTFKKDESHIPVVSMVAKRIVSIQFTGFFVAMKNIF